MTQVPFVDLGRQHAALGPELEAAFARVVRASDFTLGEEVERFELEFASYCGVRHCVGVASGTAALTIAMMAAGVGRGDEVIVPAHTFIASALSVVHAGAKPVFCDVKDETGLIDPESARAAVTERTAAIMPVHLYGRVGDMEAILDLAHQRGLAVFEDAAQAHGATHAGGRVGSLGTAAGFSFYPTKNLGAVGDGGAICTDDLQLADRARQLRNLGQGRSGEHLIKGLNERIDGLQAAVLRVKLPHLDGWNAQRGRHARAYRAALAGSVRLVEEGPESSCVHHLFPIRSPERDALGARLSTLGVGTQVHYRLALHEQPPFRDTPQRLDLPHASAWAREELSLPLFAELRQSELVHTTNAVLNRPRPSRDRVASRPDSEDER
jgi:dTDP-4-amino-4,6-dideoxygalactose transaminase